MKQRVFMVSCRRIFAPRGGFYQARLAVSDDRYGCLYRKLDSAIMVMKSAEDGRRYNVAHVLDGATDWSVFVEGPMSAQLIIIGGVLRQNQA